MASLRQEIKPRSTRKPTGLASWPMLLIAGFEKSGKSWSCAEASGSALIGRTLWISIGEDDPDDYANVPGADFEIVEHDGTYRDLLAAVEWAVAQPAVDGKPNLIIADSMTRLWDLLCDMAQDSANERARRKNKASDEADISMDLWNVAKDRWAHFMDSFRSHQGPVLLTARLDEAAVMENGKPTQRKEFKVKAEKSLPYDVAGLIQLPHRPRRFSRSIDHKPLTIFVIFWHLIEIGCIIQPGHELASCPSTLF